MVHSVELDERRPRNTRRDVAPGTHRLDLIVGAVDDEGGNADRGKQLAYVCVAEDQLLGKLRARTRTDTHHARQPRDLFWVSHVTWRELGEELLRVLQRSPITRLGEIVVPLGFRPLPWVVRRLFTARGDRVQDQTEHAVGARGSAHRALGAGVRISEENRSRCPDVVHDCDQVVDEIL